MVLECCGHSDEGQGSWGHSDAVRGNLVHSGEAQDCWVQSTECEVNWGHSDDRAPVYLVHTGLLLGECSDTGDNQSKVVGRMG